MKIKKVRFSEIVQHCQNEYPKEACGILAGKGDLVTKAYKMTNTSETPATCYFMDPKEQFKVMKEIRNLGLEMVGIYHSHLETEAYPSAHDVELAFYPETSYIIISLKDKDNPNIRSFKIGEGKIIEEEVRIK